MFSNDREAQWSAFLCRSHDVTNKFGKKNYDVRKQQFHTTYSCTKSLVGQNVENQKGKIINFLELKVQKDRDKMFSSKEISVLLSAYDNSDTTHIIKQNEMQCPVTFDCIQDAQTTDSKLVANRARQPNMFLIKQTTEGTHPAHL